MIGPKACFPKYPSSRGDTLLHRCGERVCMWRCSMYIWSHETAISHTSSAQAALFKAAARKFLSASCCTQMARHLSSNCSVHVARHRFLSARRSALVSVHKVLGLSCGGAPRTTVVLKSYVFPGVRSACYVSLKVAIL